MNKPLLYFSHLIIVANILILSVGYVANITFIALFLDGLIAIGTDPIILILGALLGAGLVAKPYKFSVIYLKKLMVMLNLMRKFYFLMVIL